jgi:hypothetical protein
MPTGLLPFGKKLKRAVNLRTSKFHSSRLRNGPRITLRPKGAAVGWVPMTYHNLHVRSGLTAIAAVLALSSTPIAAQETVDPLAPVSETAPEPAPAADPAPVVEPAASEPTATEAATTAAPAPIRRTATRARPTTTSRSASAPVRSPAPATPAQNSESTADTMPVAPPSAAPIADPVAAPPVEEPVAETYSMPADDALPIAGAAGLGLLALGGIGLAMGRRRRRREELAHYAANQEYLDHHPEAGTPASEPVFARTTQPAMAAAAPAVRTDVPRTELPSGFDLSRFGPHVRAAYQGPTEDNPSLSLKHRLRRAGAMDQQARLHGEAPVETVKPSVRPESVKKPLWNAQGEGFIFRPARGNQPSRPAFQK